MEENSKVKAQTPKKPDNQGAKNVVSANWMVLKKPTDYKVKFLKENVAVFENSPLERGFGITLGNALRRILLSSLQGAAISSVKFEGVDHEYSNIPGVREDVVDTILNLKGVVLKFGGSEKKNIMLKATGPCIVTAGMIDTPFDVEVINKDHVICTLDKNAKLNMELSIMTGKGYISANENRSADMALGVIPIDSIFSPVKRVSYKIENSRVGSETEYDKLFLTVETNGSISPELAVGLAAKILQEQLQIFIKFGDIEEPKQREEEKLPFDIQLLRKVDELELSVRAHNCLKNDNIRYIGELAQKSEAEMLKTPNFGRKSLNEIKELLTSMGLKFDMKVEGWPPENIEELVKKYEEQLS